MRAILVQNHQAELRRDYPQPVPEVDEALIRITLAGVCSTDLELIKGYYQFAGVLGHEFVGVVVQCAEATWVGKRVVGTINLGCRTCAVCLQDGPEHCPTRRTLGIWQKDGVFADYQTLPIVNLVAVPDAVPDEVAVFTEPFAAALRIREQLPIRPTDRIAVVGPGRLGLLIGLQLALTGNSVVMLGRQMTSLALPQRWGLAVGLSADYPDDHFDFVVEATGNEVGLRESLRLVRPRGTLVLKSTFHGQATFDLTKIVVSEINLVGSRCGPFAPALRLLATGQIPVCDMIEAIYDLDDALAALAHANRPGVRKILLRP
ncbi:MAG: alcohol dehydrogenase catalytic domain-containing protein [Chloroflexi bacterium]|nr:alcohol dehydrogenase catalytic domain-containing protein [Chloroflexota bacterium]MBP8056406.1 alcohol dehydrogenase catalytic domain-containing protein [Chloroflexota bacterium]